MIKKDGNDCSEISVYKGELTKKAIVECNLKLKKSFPGLPVGFFDVFSDRIKENNFNDERLTNAVNYVIDNCVYPTPTIAQFISFDKRIKLYNYNQILKLNDELSGKAFEYYRPVRIGENEKPVYAHINDIKEFNLIPWQSGR